MKSPSLSLCLIVKNEADHLPRCLQSVQGVVDEIIVVDTGSSDATPTLAKAFGARVFHFPWQDDFALARNLSLEQAHGDWILVLDADEELPPETQQGLSALLSEPAFDGYQLLLRNVNTINLPGVPPEFPLVRLFRNRPEYRYEQSVHEQILYAILRHGGKVGETQLPVLHYGYSQETVQGGEKRSQRNLRLLEQAVNRDPGNLYLAAKLALTFAQNGDDAAAYTLLKKVIYSPDRENLSPEFLSELRTALAEFALRFGDYSQAVEWAALALHDAGTNRIYAMLYLAKAQIRSVVQRYQQVSFSSPPSTSLEALVEAVAARQTVLRELLQDLTTSLRLLEQGMKRNDLPPSLEQELQKERRVCLGALQELHPTLEAARQSPAQLLDALLSADDLPCALLTLAPGLDRELLQLVEAQAAQARSEDQFELAEGLDDLAFVLTKICDSPEPACVPA